MQSQTRPASALSCFDAGEVSVSTHSAGPLVSYQRRQRSFASNSGRGHTIWYSGKSDTNISSPLDRHPLFLRLSRAVTGTSLCPSQLIYIYVSILGWDEKGGRGRTLLLASAVGRGARAGVYDLWNHNLSFKHSDRSTHGHKTCA